MTKKANSEIVCTACGDLFTTRVEMKIHFHSVHKKVQPVVCNYCPYVGDETSVNNHAKRSHLRHLPRERYRCHLCTKDFSTRSNLMIHLRSHTGERPFFCTHCPKTFCSKQGRDRHCLTHNKNYFRCEFCAFRAFSEFQLISHKKHCKAIPDAVRIAERKKKRLRVLHGITTEDPSSEKIVKMNQSEAGDADAEAKDVDDQAQTETPPPPPNFDKDDRYPKDRMSEVLRPRMSASSDLEQKAAAQARYKMQQTFDPYNFTISDAKGAIETPPPPPPPSEKSHGMVKMDYPHHYLMPEINLQDYVAGLTKKIESLVEASNSMDEKLRIVDDRCSALESRVETTEERLQISHEEVAEAHDEEETKQHSNEIPKKETVPVEENDSKNDNEKNK